MDFIMTSLCEGDYASTDTLANNWLNFIQVYEEVQVLLKKPGVIEFITRTDHLLASDLMAAGRTIAIINNFMRCVAKQSSLRKKSW